MSDLKLFKKPPPLDTEHFQGWSIIIQKAFAYHGWSHYLYTTEETIETTTSSSDRPSTDPIAPQFKPEQEAAAYAFLLLAIPVTLSHKVQYCTTAAEIWKNLNQEFNRKTRYDKLHSKALVSEVRRNTEESLETFI